VLKALEADYGGKVQFFQLDASSPDNAAVLPKDVAVASYPGFLLLKNGKTTSWRGGMPFGARGASGGGGESTEEYQLRLARWFRAAIKQQDLTVPE
jgi:hypothetical protein